MRIATVLSLAAVAVLTAGAANPEKYASSSMLAEGTWVKIDIKTPGLQTLTRQTLKNFGFNDSKPVYVYGYGGRMISEILSPGMVDDLPAVPVLRKDDGSISFYAAGNITIKQNSAASSMTYTHSINPYAETAYYFLSDRVPETETEVVDLPCADDSKALTTFTRQLVHERDILQCADSGRDYLGEDFRQNKSQTFSFDLTGNAGESAQIRIRFATNTSGAGSSIIVSANGERLPASSNDKISAVTSSSNYYRLSSSVKTAEVSGNSLAVGIEYQQGGTVNIARLDWIEVEYTQKLALQNSQLYFHVSPKSPTAYRISGVSKDAVIWDVTDPSNVKQVTGTYNEAEKTLSIGLKKSGLQEFFVMEPSAKGATPAGRIKVSNQNIHGMPTPDMVVITPEEYTSVAERIADLHRRHDGMTVYVLTPEKIYNEFSSGNADISAFRKLHKMWYDRSRNDSTGRKFGYSLLIGRPTYDQKRKNPEVIKQGYPNMLIWQSGDLYTETSSFCTDDFIAMLNDESKDEALYLRKQLIGVGRYPITSLEEGNVIADKLEEYMTAPEYGFWRNNVMVIADDGDSANHFYQAQNSIKHMVTNEAGSHYAYDRVYLDAFERKQSGSGLTFPDATNKMLKKWEKEGVALINYIGHANPKEWGHEKLLTWLDITNMTNQRLPVLYAATCSFGKWDAESVSGAEVMVNNPAGGVIAAITPSRTVYITPNGDITNAVSDYVFARDEDGRGMRLGDILRLGKNKLNEKNPLTGKILANDNNMIRYHLFGDPALRMITPKYTVCVDSIAGLPVVEDLADAPSVKARSTVSVSGRITGPQGDVSDFNGQMQYTLFDAEKSIITNGYDDGKEEPYQDRSSKLATGNVMVRDGKWSAKILMPAEIANNYSPALLSLYAFDPDKKEEANGSTQQLYVYGYDTDAADDSEGPLIERFGLNSQYGPDRILVDSDPVATVVISDESGINISDAGIGHKMSFMLDSATEYDDVSNFYVPDTETEGKGTITYPLSGLQPGDHELKLTVWDNANNSSSATISFTVGINLAPKVTELTSVYNRDLDILTIRANVDRPLSKLGCKFECFDLNGGRLWSLERNANSGKESLIDYQWDLCDYNGRRLPRGIYIIKTTVRTQDGLETYEKKKIAIPAK